MNSIPENVGLIIGDIWLEVENILDEYANDPPFLKMLVLGAFQNKAQAFGLERSLIGLPLENADHIFARGAVSGKGS